MVNCDRFGWIKIANSALSFKQDADGQSAEL